MRRVPQTVVQVLLREWPLSVNVATTALFLAFGKRWLADLSSPSGSPASWTGSSVRFWSRRLLAYLMLIFEN